MSLGENIGSFLFPDRRYLALLALAMLFGAFFRLAWLGNPFVSSDNAQVAVKTLFNPGYAWMLKENYGILITLIVKIFIGIFSQLGFPLTEFLWKLPIALFGIALIPLVYYALGLIARNRATALVGSWLTACFPLHVMQSRFLYGSEVLSVFFLLCVIVALVRFYEAQSWTRGLIASVAIGLYLISHVYILPFVIVLPIIVIACSIKDATNWKPALVRGGRLFFTKGLWIIPILISPLLRPALDHTTRKETKFGFYLLDHWEGITGNVGYALLFSIFVSVFYLFVTRKYCIMVWVFLMCGGVYLAPLIIGAPPGITVVRGYMVIGLFFCILMVSILLGKWMIFHRNLAIAATVVIIASTSIGLTLSLFINPHEKRALNAFGVKLERGTILDTGIKAAGYLIQRHIPPDKRVLAIHRSVEPPNLLYYFNRREGSWFDLTLEQTLEKLQHFAPQTDVIICEEIQLPVVKQLKAFDQRVVLQWREQPVMWIFTRHELTDLPKLNISVEPLNDAFDKENKRTVSLNLF